jgi:hypothetical protein
VTDAVFALPEEFRDEPPRAIPEKVRHGRRQRRLYAAVWGLLAAGGMCLFLSPWPWMRTLGLYVLPLAYLDWIGWGLLALAATTFVNARLNTRAYRYIVEGRAAPAVVRSLAKLPKTFVNGQPSAYCLVATVEVEHPDTGGRRTVDVTSRDIPAMQKDTTHAPFRVGDTVVAVWLPGQFDKTLQLYDFLELVPEHELSRGGEGQSSPVATAVAVAVFVPLFLAVLFWNVYAFGRYAPIEEDWSRDLPILLVGGVVVGLPFVGWLYWQAVRERRKVQERNAQAAATGEAVESEEVSDLVGGGWKAWGLGLILVPGGIGLGGATVLCWAYTANALLDDSPARTRPVVLNEFVETTHAFLFREYQVKYEFFGERDQHSLLTTPQNIDELVLLPLGQAEVHKGAFGWEWVRAVRPPAGR